MGAEALVWTTVGTLRQQPEIKLAQHDAEPVRILQEHGRGVWLTGRAWPLNAQQVVKAMTRPGQPGSKDLATSQPLHAHDTAACGSINQINAKSTGQVGMDPELPVTLLHAQNGKGVRVSGARQRGNVLSVQHSRTRLAGPVGRSVA